jgi:hypothetical protein
VAITLEQGFIVWLLARVGKGDLHRRRDLCRWTSTTRVTRPTPRPLEVQQSIKVYSPRIPSQSSAAPAAGGAGGSYSPGASATSGDTVVRTLSSSLHGLFSLSGDTVTFTGLGTCQVDSLMIPATEPSRPPLRSSRASPVHSGNYIDASTAPAAGVIHATYSRPARRPRRATQCSYHAFDGSSTGCTIDKGKVTFASQRLSARVDFNDPGNGDFAAAKEVQQVIDQLANGLDN